MVFVVLIIKFNKKRRITIQRLCKSLLCNREKKRVNVIFNVTVYM